MDAATGRNYYENPSLKRLPSNRSSEWGSKRSKRIKTNEGYGYTPTASSTTSWRFEADQKRNYACSELSGCSDPVFFKLAHEFDSGRFGSVSKEIEEIIARRRQIMDVIYARDPKLPFTCSAVQTYVPPKLSKPATPEVIDLDLDDEPGGTSFLLRRIVPAVQNINSSEPVVIDLDDDDDDDATKSENQTCQYLGLNLPMPSVPEILPSAPGKLCMKDFLDRNFSQIHSTGRVDAWNAGGKGNNTGGKGDTYNDEGKRDAYSVEGKEDAYDAGGKGDSKNYIKVEIMEDKGEYVGTDEEESDEMSDTNPDDGLGDIWNQMTVALEYSKDVTEDAFLDEHGAEFEEDCEHIFILKDDLGDVCRICGVIRRGIESMIEYNFSKNTRSTRTYKYEGRTPRELDLSDVLPDIFKPSGDFTAADINPHPRHRKEMKPHQIEGFNFLLSNLVTDNPGGCIMAHAPGSGKTFMIISFLQSFMAKYPAARPLVILPKGILSIWKKEFTRWQVEDLPLYDFYSVKADSRERQLEVLKAWEQERSILFLGYMQFSSIICDTNGGPIASVCQNYLLKIPTILILDEGHTPRNQDTDILTSLERVETTRKVVLSGTLYQNHVKEVFNILNLVRPRFLKLDNPKVIKKRILSMVEISGRRNFLKENDFYELIEQTLTKDENYTRKENVIRELRGMTKSVLHYYKGDNLDELPGLVDFSVFLRLKPLQKAEVKQLRLLNRKFTISAQGSAIYVHPKLKTLSKNTGVKDRVDEEKIDAILEKFDVREGVKANFYLNLLRMCESSGEKMLVFSQYLLPLKFLERLTAKVKGYSLGREMFMITGDSDAEMRETSMEKFNNSPDARVFFGSIRACGEGISLVGASRIMILDVPLNPSVTRQAIGRAFRPGQVRKVYTYRLIAFETPEQDDHNVCFRKESIAKMWFEWDSFSGNRKFEIDSVEVNECGDDFLETGRLNEDIVSVLKR